MKNIIQAIVQSFTVAGKLTASRAKGIFAAVAAGTVFSTAAITNASDVIWGTYYGGSGWESVLSVHSDGSRIVIGGSTSSPNGIASPGAAQETLSGSSDGFIAVFNSNGQRQWATYIGGPSDDEVVAVRIDGASVYAAGNTNSPTLLGSGARGGKDGFVARYNPNNGQRIWIVPVGGNGDDTLWAMAIRPEDSAVIVAGETLSNNIQASGFQKTKTNWGSTGFLQSIGMSGVQGSATYYGGNGVTQIQAIHVAGNDVFIAGTTTATDLIASVGAIQGTHPNNGFNQVGFVARLDSSLSTRHWGTYLGHESGHTSAFAVSSDLNRVYVGGRTSATTRPLAFTQSPQQGMYGGGLSDGFVAALNISNGSAAWWNYLGGMNQDTVFGLHSNGSTVYATGISDSVNNISTNKAGGGGGGDAFIVAYNSSGTRLWGDYYGGADNQDDSRSIHRIGSDLLIAGKTRSTQGIAAGGNPHQSTLSGWEDGFLLRVKSTGVDKTLKISGPSKVNTKVGEINPINMQVTANGPATEWKIVSAPNWSAYWLQINHSGVITGTFYQPGVYTITVEASNALNNPSNQHEIEFTVSDTCPQLSIQGATTGYTAQPINISVLSNKNVKDWVISPALPNGLSFSKTSNSATISGTLSYTFNQNYTITAKTDCGQDQSLQVNLVVTTLMTPPCTNYLGAQVTIDGKVGVAMNYTDLPKQINNQCGQVKGWRTSTGTPLPAGLSIHPTTGVISGTPTQPTTSHYAIIEAWNDAGIANIIAYFNIAQGEQKPCFTQSSVTINGTVGQALQSTDLKTYLGNNNCGQPTSWQVVSGSLPGGININNQGVITGTPTAAVNQTVTVRAANSMGNADIQVNFNIAAGIQKPNFSPKTISIEKKVNEFFEIDLKNYNIGGTAANWTRSGTLPSGVNFLNGVISGQSSVPANSTLTITASNSAGNDTITVYLNILQQFNKPVITGPAVVSGVFGTEIQAFTPEVNGQIYNNIGQINWEIVSGSFPTGISMHPSNGWISGTPGKVGNGQTVTIRVQGPGGWSNPFTMTFNISDAKPFISANTYQIDGMANKPLNHPVLSGGTPSGIGGPITSWNANFWQNVPGLNFNQQTGVFSGVITKEGNYVLKVTASGPGGVSNELTIVYNIVAELKVPKLINPGDKVFEFGKPIQPFTIQNTGGPVDTYWFEGMPQMGLIINDKTGTISGIPYQLGENQVTVKAINSQGGDSVSFKIAIKDQKPVIIGPKEVTVVVGEAIDIPIEVDFSKGVTAKWNVQNLPTGLQLFEYTQGNIHPEKGTYHIWTLPRLQGTFNSVGNRNITLTAETAETGLAKQVSDPFTVSIKVVNAPIKDIDWDLWDYDWQVGLRRASFSGALGVPLPTDLGNRWFVRNQATPSDIVSVRHIGSLPPGVSYEIKDNGILFKGTPTQVGNYTATIYGKTSTGKETGFVMKATISNQIVFTNLPQTLSVKEGETINFKIEVSPANTSVSVNDMLPSFLQFNPVTNRVTGKVPVKTPWDPPVQQHTTTFRGELNDGITVPQVSGALTIIVTKGDVPVPQPPTLLPTAYIGEPYSAVITALPNPTVSFQVEPYSPLPPGLTATVNNQGQLVITGVPQGDAWGNPTGQPTSFSVAGSNEIGKGPAVVYTIPIQMGRPQALQSPIKSSGQVGIPYSFNLIGQIGAPAPNISGMSPQMTSNTIQLTPIGNTPPLSSIGLSLNSATIPVGQIQGTPTQSGTYRYQVTATNLRGSMLQPAEFVLTIGDKVPEFSKPNNHQYIVYQDEPANIEINVLNNPTSITFNGNTLATYGMSAAVQGSKVIISGTPNSLGVAYLGITATNATGTASVNYSVRVEPGRPVLADIQNLTVTKGQNTSIGISAIRGAQPITYSLTPINGTPSLASLGWSFNSQSGNLTIQTSNNNPGTYRFRAGGSNARGLSLNNPEFTITVVLPPLPEILPPLQYVLTEGVAASGVKINATNNPTQFSAVPVPNTNTPLLAELGLQLNTQTGVITGVPDVDTARSAAYQYQVVATNPTGSSQPATLRIRINPMPPPTITGPTQITANINQPVNVPIVATGNPAGYEFSVSPNNPGISISGGAIVGTPTVPGDYTINVRPIVNGNPVGNPVPIQLTVRPLITGPGTISGTVGTPLTGGSIQAQGNPTLSATSSNPAPGITFSNGAFTGTPTQSGTYTYTVVGTANGVQSQPFTVTLQIAPPPPQLQNNNNYTFVIGQAVNQQIPVTNGPANITVVPTFNVPGLTISATGLITGTPTGIPNTYNYTIQANNGTAGNVANLKIETILPPTQTPLIQSASLLRQHGSQTIGLNLSLGSIATSDSRSGSQAVLRIIFPANFVPVNNVVAQVQSGNATLGTIQTYGNNVAQIPITINANNQKITVKIVSVNGQSVNNGNQVSFRVIRGDANSNGRVDSVDISLIQAAIGQTTNASNFLRDITVDGIINSADLAAAQSNIGGSAPQ